MPTAPPHPPPHSPAPPLSPSPAADRTDAAGTAPHTQHVEWLGLSLHLPDHWEIVRHATSPRKGSLAFADRTRQRLQVTWTQCVRTPDVGRLLSDHRSRQREQDPAARFEAAALPDPWRGVVHHLADGHRLLRAAQYHHPTRRLLEAVYAPPSDKTQADAEASAVANRSQETAALLAGLQIIGPADLPRLRAFGLCAAWPEDWRLVRAQVRPADVTLTLAPAPPSTHTRQTKAPPRRPSRQRDAAPPPSATGSARVTLRRQGLADRWFDNDLAALLRDTASPAKLKPADPSALHDNDTAIQPPDADQVTGRWDLPGPRYRRLLGRHRVALATLRHAHREAAVYHLIARGPARRPLSLAGFHVGPGTTPRPTPAPGAGVSPHLEHKLRTRNAAEITLAAGGAW